MLGRFVIVVILGVGVLGVTLLEIVVLGVLGVFGKVLFDVFSGTHILGVFGVETDVLLIFLILFLGNVLAISSELNLTFSISLIWISLILISFAFLSNSFIFFLRSFPASTSLLYVLRSILSISRIFDCSFSSSWQTTTSGNGYLCFKRFCQWACVSFLGICN